MPRVFPHALRPLVLLGFSLHAISGATPVMAQGAAPPAPTTPATPDWSLLRKAVAAVQTAPAAQCETDMQMTGTQQGLSFTAREHIKITFKGASKFHSEVTILQPDGAPGVKYTTISDSVKVWTYRPGLKQYSVTSLQDFEQSNSDFFVVGVFASFISSVKSSDLTNEAFQAMKATNTIQTLDGIDYSVYALNVPGQEGAMKFFVNPRAQMIQRMEIQAKQGLLQFSAIEKVQSQTTLPVVPPGTFRFVPPPGTKKVKPAAITPFG